MKEELAKRYEPTEFEQRIYASWEKGGYFTPCQDPDRPKCSIASPPPNGVTPLNWYTPAAPPGSTVSTCKLSGVPTARRMPLSGTVSAFAV